jgi:hypothetical protein
MNNRYRRGSTPILHVPTKDEWRKLYHYIYGTVGGVASLALFAGLVIIAINYRAYLADKVLLTTTGLSILYTAVIAISLGVFAKITVPITLRGRWAIEQRKRPNFLNPTVGSGLLSVVFSGLAIDATNRMARNIVVYINRINYLRANPDVSEAKLPFDIYTELFNNASNVLVYGLAVGLLLIVVMLSISVHKTNSELHILGDAQGLTIAEHFERESGIAMIKEYCTTREMKRKAAVLLYMYDHLNPDNWIWTSYESHTEPVGLKMQPDAFKAYLNVVYNFYLGDEDYHSSRTSEPVGVTNEELRQTLTAEPICITQEELRHTLDGQRDYFEQYIAEFALRTSKTYINL